MSKKTFIIISTISLFVLLGALVVYYFFLSPASQSTTGPVATIRQLFPFGSSTGTATTTEPVRPVEPEVKPTLNFTQRIRKIWSDPVAGVGTLDVKAGTIVRHMERATGHIYETEMFSPIQNRISNTTIPQIYNAFWSNKNNSVVVERLADDEETVNSYVFTIKNSSTTENNINGALLGDKIEDISTFGDNIFYLRKLSIGSIGYFSVADSNKAKEVWNSPIKELTSQFVNKNTVALNTKPYQTVAGYLYFVDVTTGQAKKILGGIYGLTTLVNSNLLNLIYLSQNDTPSLSLYDIKKQTSSTITPTTFPEKCVWSKKDTNIVYCAVPQGYLDSNSLTSWYMGITSFTDDIWKYDLKNNTSSVVSYLTNENGGEVIDVIKPMLSENEQYFIFINKKDGSLWSLDLTKN